MNIVFELLERYLYQEKWMIIAIVAVVFSLNIIQTNFLSTITAGIIDSIEHKNYSGVYGNLKYFGAVSLLYLVLYGVNEMIQTNMLTKLTQWLRRELFEHLVRSNNENMSQINMLSYNTPINRVTYTIYSMISSILNYLLTHLVFIIVICSYFLYKYPKYGACFLTANILIFVYVYFNLGKLTEMKIDADETMINNENIILDMFNNFDKIIYRGESNHEMENYRKRADECVDKNLKFYAMSNTHAVVLTSYVYVILFFSVLFLIALHQTKKVDNKMFIMLFTVLLMYREKITSLIQLIPTFLEFNARYTTVLVKLDSLDTNKDVVTVGGSVFKKVDLPFEKIIFKNVYFKYDASKEYVLNNYNLALNTNNKIIGVTGISGRGKSTIMKLLIKLYSPEKGEITVDGVNIKELDPEYIRKNITYVNQNSRLFDRKVMDNIMYGCMNPDKCETTLKEILKYPKIQKLFQGIDLSEKQAGSLGENLSGGQRQIVNIISGLVNPSKILVLDEPTNALDGELKKELIQIIKDFKKHKKCIIIITHDKELVSIFDEKINVG